MVVILLNKIVIIGSNCSNGIKLGRIVNKIADNYKDEILVQFADDSETLKKYNITNVPGLMINDKLVSQGKILSEREIIRLLRV